MGERLTLYGRSYCHLCDDMVKALEGLRDSLGFSLHVADVDEDPDLETAVRQVLTLLE